VLKPLNGTEIV